MKDYFYDLKQYLANKYTVVIKAEEVIDVNRCYSAILGHVTKEVKYIYDHYQKLQMIWRDSEQRYIGSIQFVAYSDIEHEHNMLVDIMNECYDFSQDEFEICDDIKNWFPIFYFPNGDAFCLDRRNMKIVFYDHEVYDVGRVLHGIVIANSINDLFERWSKCHFVDVYDWSMYVDDNGLDISLFDMLH